MIRKLAQLALLSGAVTVFHGAPLAAQSDDVGSPSAKAIPEISMATDLFSKYCLDTRDDITVLIDLLPSEGFEWVTATKRFEHPTHDLSFALLQSELGFACSMQFANHVDPATSAAIFVKKTASRNAIVNVGIPEDASGRNYVQASVASEAVLSQ